MNQQAYLDTYSAFVDQLKQDAGFLLTLCDFWLDPIYAFERVGDYEAFYQEENYEWTALHVARDLWPTLYAEMSWMSWEGQGALALERYVVGWVNQHIPYAIHSIEELYFGIPFQFMGRNTQYEDDGSLYQAECELLDTLFDAMDYTALSTLIRGYQETCPELAMAMNWAFKRSGNSSFDYSWDESGEIMTESLDWTESSLEFAWEIHLEAWAFEHLAHFGFDMLQDEDVIQDLIDSAMIALSVGVQKTFHDHDSLRRSLAFKRPGELDESRPVETAAGDSVLRARDCDAA